MAAPEIDERGGPDQLDQLRFLHQVAPLLTGWIPVLRGEYADVSFQIGKGEVVGLTGLLGAGRTELALTLCTPLEPMPPTPRTTTVSPGSTRATRLRACSGVATPGPRNDGAYYQTLVDCVNRLVKANNGTAIIVDNIPAADAATQIESLVKQNVDIMMVGASEIRAAL